MRVMCISHEVFDDSLPMGPDDPQIGDECEVVCVCVGIGDRGIEKPCYELEGYNSEWVYDQRNFATLPDTTADEMQEETKEGIANLETA
jgi:hypothetical protein